jgi:hypothetical protein
MYINFNIDPVTLMKYRVVYQIPIIELLDFFFLKEIPLVLNDAINHPFLTI